jgi:hypothetical protein
MLACTAARSRTGAGCGVHRPAFVDPLRQAAVEDDDVARAHDLEGPPDARRGGEPDAVIDDDLLFLVDAERADCRGEILGRGQHVGEGN